MRRTAATLCVLFLFFPLLSISLSTVNSTDAAPASFVFTAGGDFSANSRTSAGLDLIPGTGASFHLALGDFSYSQLTPESTWCDYVKAHVGPEFPFELLAGNHEDNGPDGLIENFAACLPDRIGKIQGEYGKEYYFDFPPADPTARFILISPDLTFSNGQIYSYVAGTPRYAWLADTIDSARLDGLRWVIVGMHKNCLTMSTKPCEIGADLMNLLISKKVDLALQSHDHTYQRSKQLAVGPACPIVPVDLYDPGCVVDDGADHEYTAGAGTVFVISATSGGDLYDVNPLDPEAEYFIRWMGLNAEPRHGFMKYTVAETGITAEFIGSTPGSFSDGFTLAANPATFTPPPTPTRTFTPTATQTSPAGSASLTFPVQADARVKQASPASNYGGLSYLSVDGAPDPAEESYLRFTVSGLGGPVQSAGLRLYVTTNRTNNGPAVHLAGDAWSESTLTWNTRPALLGPAADNTGALASNTWIEYDVTSLVGGDGTYTFALIADSTDGAEFASREGSFPAQLVVSYATSLATATAAPSRTATPTSTATSTATAAASPSATPTFTASGLPTDLPTSTPSSTATATLVPSPTPTASLLPSATLTGTATALPTATRTPAPTASRTPTATLPSTMTVPTDLIFADGFESGDLQAWSSAVTDGGDLSAQPSAALVDSRGLRAVVNNNAAMYVTDDRPAAETRYRARFYFDPNSIKMSNGNAHYLFYGYTGTSTNVVRIELRRSSGSYQLRAALRSDGSSWTASSWYAISDAPHVIELDWRAATAAGASDGGLTFWIDSVQRANLGGIDNDTRRIDRIRLGPVSGLDSGTRGAYYFDAFQSGRQSYIGPVP